MVEVILEQEFPVNADTIWAVLADFGNLDWIPGIEKIELEGEGVGMIRHVTAPGLPILAEKMEALDHDNRVLDYSIPEVEFIKVKNYRARAKVVPLGKASCRLVWSCQGEAFDVSEEQATVNTEGFYTMVMTWIGEYVGAN